MVPKGCPPPQVTDPVEGIPIEYSVACQGIPMMYSDGCQSCPPPKVRIQWKVFLQSIPMAAKVFLYSIPMVPKSCAPPSYGSNGWYPCKLFLWLPKNSYRVFLWLPMFPTLQVPDPMDVNPTEYSYGCPGRGAHSHVPCLGLIYFHSLLKC